MALESEQFKYYQGNPENARGYGDLPTRELVSEMHWNSQRMNTMLDRGYGKGYELEQMSYAPGKYNYAGHQAIMLRDIAQSQRQVADGFAAKGIKMPIMDMMDTKTRENWDARRKKDW